MIRFCDSEVGCAEYELLDRSKLLSYFLAGHLDEIVCIYDEADVFMGTVTYYSLLNSISVDVAINREYVILDDDIWRNARDIFKKKSRNIRDLVPLPVLDKDYQLICFAYQDEDANREIRMLRELCEIEGALQFADVFPQYKCVKIHGFNELAYFFADYLKSQNIPIHLENPMWQDFFKDEECEVPEYECLDIYAEGTWEKSRNWKENLLRSVSVEFECVDKIYEENIKNNYITNANGDINSLIERLRNEKEIIICGIGMEEQDAYDFLIENGIETCCFAVNGLGAEQIHKLFGKKILGFQEAMCAYHNPVFIDCVSKYSAWGLGDADYYDYLGYRRNEGFIILKDYIEVPGSNLLNALRDTEVVLIGDRYLCRRLYEYLEQKEVLVKGYLCTLEDDIQPENMPEVSVEDISEDIVCLITEPIYDSYAKGKGAGREKKGQRIACLREKNIDNFTDYFGEVTPFINIEKDNDIKYAYRSLRPQRVVVGSILNHSGNAFFRGLLDSHPLIWSIDYSDLNNLLFWICIRLSTERAENMLSLFWKLIEGDEAKIVDKKAFAVKMQQLLALGSTFTSQELFIMFHIAYMHMLGVEVSENTIKEAVIYWEPHCVDRYILEECVKWLGTEEMPCDIINVVRNSIPRQGGDLKSKCWIQGGTKSAYMRSLQCMPIMQKKYEQGDRLVIKFEDLKLRPKETLQCICDIWNIAWSDVLLQVTRRGQESVYHDNTSAVRGFDLKPVYEIYENFFSGFDRFRILLMHAAWQERYGYPYVDPNQFTRKELQEMFLKEFRFENPGDTTGFYKDSLGLDDRIEVQNETRRRMQKTRCLIDTAFEII